MSNLLIGENPNISASERPQAHRPGRVLLPQNANEADEADSFVGSDGSISSSRNRGFSFGNAIKNFFKGVISPITAIFQNPLAALPMIIAGGALAFFCPASIPLMLVAGIAFSGFELGKGIINFASSSSRGDSEGMENSFKDMGAGTIGTILSIFGIRGSAAVAAEAKAASTALRAGATEVEAVQVGLNAAREAKSIGLLQAFRENLSMVSKNGFSTLKDSICFKWKHITSLFKKLNDSNIYKIDPKLKPRAIEIYNEEVKMLAKRLGINESDLKDIAPKLEIISINRPIGGAFVPPQPICPKPRLFLNQKFSYLSNITDFIPHECRHLEQFLYPVLHLPRKVYMETYLNAFRKNCDYSLLRRILPNKLYEGIVNAMATLSGSISYLTKGKMIRQGVKVISSPGQRQRAIQQIFHNLEAVVSSREARLNISGYLNCFGEVDARMYSMLRRLEFLHNSATNYKEPMLNLAMRFAGIKKELAHESNGFRNPIAEESREMLNNIRSLMNSLTTEFRTFFRGCVKS
ncbi:MAG: hypothetical protein HY094_04480 [Candidatus Melainabacteria bacterium]|nr:hypothetical protein [Candidatus Melainabacteria bacterium]